MAVTVRKGFPWAQEDVAPSSSDDEEPDSGDEELRALWASGMLGETLVQEYKKSTINNKAALEEKLREIALDRSQLDWVERLDITATGATVKEQLEGNDGGEKDDFKRELGFYNHSLGCASRGVAQLLGFGVPVVRPTDYFAEMVKTDDHMKRVRARQIRDKGDIEKSLQMKRQRDLKKFGKKVQVEVQERRHKEKRTALERVKEIRKGRATQEDADEFNVGVVNDDEPARSGGGDNRGQAKRQQRDKKFGFGGKKRGMKKNDAKSAADTSDFSARRNKQQDFTGKRPTAGGAKKRPGKARRNMNKRK